jgi:hypothetical protein
MDGQKSSGDFAAVIVHPCGSIRGRSDLRGAHGWNHTDKEPEEGYSK